MLSKVVGVLFAAVLIAALLFSGSPVLAQREFDAKTLYIIYVGDREGKPLDSPLSSVEEAYLYILSLGSEKIRIYGCIDVLRNGEPVGTTHISLWIEPGTLVAVYNLTSLLNIGFPANLTIKYSLIVKHSPENPFVSCSYRDMGSIKLNVVPGRGLLHNMTLSTEKEETFTAEPGSEERGSKNGLGILVIGASIVLMLAALTYAFLLRHA